MRYVYPVSPMLGPRRGIRARSGLKDLTDLCSFFSTLASSDPQSVPMMNYVRSSLMSLDSCIVFVKGSVIPYDHSYT